MRLHSSSGFTLLELLTVVAIILVVVNILFGQVQQARSKAAISKAKADVHNIATAVYLLFSDTGKLPFGCPMDMMADPGDALDSVESGLVVVPPVGPTLTWGYFPHPCAWTAGEVARWRGPYVNTGNLVDPWGNGYVFDMDYYPSAFGTCPVQPDGVVVSSNGPDGLPYTCDDAVHYFYACRCGIDCHTYGLTFPACF